MERWEIPLVSGEEKERNYYKLIIFLTLGKNVTKQLLSEAIS